MLKKDQAQEVLSAVNKQQYSQQKMNTKHVIVSNRLQKKKKLYLIQIAVQNIFLWKWLIRWL